MFGDQRTGRPPDPFNPEAWDPKSWMRYLKLGAWALGVFFLLMGLGWARTFYTDWLWFDSLGYSQVLLKVVTTKLWLFLAGILLFAAVAGSNVFLVFQRTRDWKTKPTVVPFQFYGTLRKVLGALSAAAVVLLGFFMARVVVGHWEEILRFLSAVPFQRVDPIFGQDLGFYVFTLPVLHFLQGWLLSLTIVTGLLVAALYYFLTRLHGEVWIDAPEFRIHAVVLGSGIFLLLAAGHWLGRYELLYSSSGAVFGVGYTEAHASLPMHYVMTVVALLSAGLLAAGLYLPGRRLELWAIGLWLGMNLAGTGLVPTLVQRLYVEPNELAREEPFLAHHIQFTREAYGLDRVTSTSHPARGTVDARTVAENQATVQNVRLWDEGPLLQSYNQIQFFRLYYDFLAVTTDRYVIDGNLRQVMLSTRELSAEKLPSEAQRWVNRHLQFTHGYGAAVSPVTEVDAGGRPAFFLKDVPPLGALPLSRPEIYYGLKSLDYLIVRTSMQEFNYPGPDGPAYTRYEGKGGVILDSFFRRLLYAWEFRDINILISTEIQPESRIQYRRTVPQRFGRLAPFLLPDGNPYVVVADGRLFWIQDAYTVTHRYPYSARWQGRFNYIRNSVKAVVDAYHGTVDFYVADSEDPLIQTYQQIFPGMFKPLEEIPVFLKPHLRYPLDFFTVQVEMLLQYQMEDPVVFYNKEDQWALPLETSFNRTSILRPYYIVARLPGMEREEFLLIQPFTPVNRHNLVAWIAARNDPPHYGQLVLFRFPSGRHVDGPNQVEARIDNDAVISEQFTLWGQVGSEVSRGILLVIPLSDSILYAEPVFLKPETLDFPELRRIILADANKVVMHPTLDRSIAALVGELPPVAPAATAPEEISRAPTGSPAASPLLDLGDVEALRSSIRELVTQLQEVLRRLEEVSRRSGPGEGTP